MKKSKIILGCVFSVMALVLTLVIGLPNKVYASEITNNSISKTNNILDSANLYQGTTLGSSGLPVIEENNYSRVVTKEFISVIPNQTYTLTCYNSNMLLFEVNYYDIEKKCLSLNTINENDYQFTIPENCYYIILLFRMKDNSYIYVNDVVSSVMYNLGSSYLNYEPYIPLKNNNGYNDGYNAGVEASMNVNGIWKYLRNVYVGTEEDNDYSFEELKSNGFLNGYEMSLYAMASKNNESYSTVYIDFEFKSAPLTELDLFFKGYHSYTMNIYDEEGDVVNVDVSNINSLNYKDIISQNSNFGNYVDTISIVASSPDALDVILNNSSYSEGFQNGYNGGFITGKNEGYNNGYNAGVNDKENNQTNYNNGYNNGYNDGKINGYNNGYNDGASSNVETNGIKTLFNSILSYPVNLISSVLDFNFMGINVASLIMFIVSIGVVVFVVKKFW